MAIVKTKPTSAGRRHVVKIVGEELFKGRAYAPLLENSPSPAAVTTTVVSPPATWAVVIVTTIG